MWRRDSRGGRLERLHLKLHNLILDSIWGQVRQVTHKNLMYSMKQYMSNYHRNEAKFSKLTFDTFRTLWCLEWELSGSFNQSDGASLSGMGTKIGQNGFPGRSHINYSHDIRDPRLPPNYSIPGPHFAWPPLACKSHRPRFILFDFLSSYVKI